MQRLEKMAAATGRVSLDRESLRRLNSGIKATGALAGLDADGDGIISRIEVEMVENKRARSAWR